ncbi:DUF4911 domain-containing protein [Orenia marismortui]|uniref:Uncharacterized protein DUF4911 n=1 Tax=Orenia marismortui TaxID=46469 RepID=A0A4R8GM60_9FIRM|nr:DUF4911 domain-containing protein [Orenia marismortui]TDX46772.1 uncharacterized protein DUF4911 [Orenia marismortui]
MDTIGFQVQVEQSELYFVDNILKSYEGLAFTTVVGVEDGIGTLNVEVSAGTKEDVLEILHNLENQIDLEIIKG